MTALMRRVAAAVFITVCLLSATAQSAQEKRILLWRVESGASTVFLLGSVHVAKPDIYPLNGYIESAFASAVRLAVEVDITKLEQTAFQKKILALGVLPQDRTLSGELGAAAAAVAAKLAEFGMGMGSFERFKPWVVYMTIASMDLAALGLDSDSGVDLHYLRRAGDREVIELETVDSQLELLAGFSDAEQRALLLEYLEENAKLSEEAGALFDAWMAGDDMRLAELVRGEADASALDRRIEEALLRRRDAGMAERIRGLLKLPGTSFVVVGAAHLSGAGGIVDLLAKAGFRVTVVRE
jgi:uncharacterized protein YbaP (TraB family)